MLVEPMALSLHIDSDQTLLERKQLCNDFINLFLLLRSLRSSTILVIKDGLKS